MHLNSALFSMLHKGFVNGHDCNRLNGKQIHSLNIFIFYSCIGFVLCSVWNFFFAKTRNCIWYGQRLSHCNKGDYIGFAENKTISSFFLHSFAKKNIHKKDR